MQLMAGAPIAIADQYTTIGDNAAFYQNEEILFLNKDGFVGRPLKDSLSDQNSQIWYGELSNHDIVVGFFNREETVQSKRLRLSDIDLSGEWKVHNLWTRQDEGIVSENLTYEIPPHGCKILRLSPQ